VRGDLDLSGRHGRGAVARFVDPRKTFQLICAEAQ